MSDRINPRSDCDRYLFFQNCLRAVYQDSLKNTVLLCERTLQLVTQNIGPIERLCDDILNGVDEPVNRARTCFQRDEADLAIKEVVEELRFKLRNHGETESKDIMRQYGVVFKEDSNKYSSLFFQKKPISA